MRLTPLQSAAVNFSVELLPDREREVVHCRFWGGWTLQAIGDLLGVTRERARQILVKALELIRPWIEPYFDFESWEAPRRGAIRAERLA